MIGLQWALKPECRRTTPTCLKLGHPFGQSPLSGAYQLWLITWSEHHLREIFGCLLFNHIHHASAASSTLTPQADLEGNCTVQKMLWYMRSGPGEPSLLPRLCPSPSPVCTWTDLEMTLDEKHRRNSEAADISSCVSTCFYLKLHFVLDVFTDLH